MQLYSFRRRIALLGIACLGLSLPVMAQNDSNTPLPQAPNPQAAPSQSQQQPTQDEIRRQQLKQEEHQRILGVIPNFNTVEDKNALPLTPKQKFSLAYRSSIDPFTFVAAAADAGLSQAEDDFPGYGQGAAGYGKRFGASYADSFDGNLWGSAIFPVLLHEDPRYFRMGQGSFNKRLWYSISTTVWSRRDDASWGPNYGNVLGNLVAGGISNIYYPSTDRGAGLTFERAFTVTAEGTIGAVFVEFWPDISGKLFHKKTPPTQRITPAPAIAPHPEL